ncbi:hypothetical protein GCM10010269_22840 [Streptomyces humidus]|uniref:Uncharacterized protein n=1 Tax=Streptomyces humidus TaxID=52259 RepID=A0A918FTT6_9ACTN|nr:hypothetical protein [Streptomyces humidus]GGR83147.1 hypothetical protein GCM10010269_22840 [Streptomyces humidus]
MAEHPQGPGENVPVPRDLPDQQAGGGDDRWDVAEPEESREAAEDVPDTDEAGTGRQGAPHAGSGGSESPEPEEPTA